MTDISVVVPTYNRSHLIRETLDAILAQTHAPHEIIVVDDGSTDDTRTVLASYGERIRAISIANSGDLVARNTGLRIAQGHLVAFCDSDDLWMPGYLAEMSAQWRAEPRLLSCYSDFRTLQDGNLSAYSKFQSAPIGFWSGLRATGPDSGVFDQEIAGHLLMFQPLFVSCMTVSRGPFIDAGGWDEGVSRIVGCDFATALRVAMRPKLGIVKRPLVAIRKHGGNISGDTEKMNLGDACVLEYVLRTRPELAALAPQIQASIASRRQAALDSAFLRRDFAAVREIHRKLPPGASPPRLQIKRAIAGLPQPLNSLVAAMLSVRTRTP
jgi:glycosyltransferase involved in cell wall biosynthesis